MIFVVLYEGESTNPRAATPIIASSAPAIVSAVAEGFVKKLGARTPAEVRRLQMKPAPEPAPRLTPEQKPPAA